MKNNLVGKTQTPSSNTGLKCQLYPHDTESNSSSDKYLDIAVKVDWLQGTLEFLDESRFCEAVNFVLAGLEDTGTWNYDTPAFMGKTWQHSGKSTKGIKWGWNNSDLENGCLGHGFISVPGGVLSNVSQRDVWRVMCGLHFSWGFKATRVDVALDDFGKTINPQLVIDAIKAENTEGFRTSNLYQNFDKEYQGWSIYMGSSQSDRCTRYYNKEAESKGEVNSYRWEVQLRNKFAQTFVEKYVSLSSESYDFLAPHVLSSIVTSGIGFVDRSENKRLSRLRKLGWWQEFIDKVGKAKLSIVRKVKSIERSIGWIKKQVANTLYVLRDGLGRNRYNHFMQDIFELAKSRINSSHEALISQTKYEFGEGRLESACL